MKKVFSVIVVLLVAAISLSVLSGCGSTKKASVQQEDIMFKPITVKPIQVETIETETIEIEEITFENSPNVHYW